MVKIFGAALDPLDTAERVDIKIAYLEWLKSRQPWGDNLLDPYDFLEARLGSKYPGDIAVEWIGKFPVETWLGPKPSIGDLERISQDNYTAFLDNNGCCNYNNKLVDYLRQNMNSCIPFMIGVDHCLTGGVVKYLKDRYDEFNLLVFDSHCDLIDLELRRRYFEPFLLHLCNPFENREVYECGNFLSYILREEVVRPENLWIIGAQDLDAIKSTSEPLFNRKILPWIREGMHVLSKDELLRSGIPADIKGPTYISFDMDFGSMASVLAARFLNYPGVNREQFESLIGQLFQKIGSGSIHVIGMDIMEIDVHFLGANVCGNEDHTGEISTMILESLIYNLQNRGE